MLTAIGIERLHSRGGRERVRIRRVIEQRLSDSGSEWACAAGHSGCCSVARSIGWRYLLTAMGEEPSC